MDMEPRYDWYAIHIAQYALCYTGTQLHRHTGELHRHTATQESYTGTPTLGGRLFWEADQLDN